MRPSTEHDKAYSPSSPFQSTSRRPPRSPDPSPRSIRINIASDPLRHREPSYLQRLWQRSQARRFLSLLRIRFLKRYQEASYLEVSILALAIVVSSALLLIHVGFFSGKKYQDWHQDHVGWLEEIDLLDKVYPDEGRSLSTAIVVIDEDNDDDKVQTTIGSTVSRLCQYEMFKHIMVWNNNPNNNRSIESLNIAGCSPDKIILYNAQTNWFQYARYLACSLAQTPYCYFADHSPARHLRSVYANFIRSPHLIHSELRKDQYAQVRWSRCFFNQAQLHTCYAPMRGAFASKETVAQFMQLVDLIPIDSAYADMYFISYLNQVPYAVEGFHGTIPAINDKDISKTEEHHMRRGLIAAYRNVGHENSAFATGEFIPSVRHTRAPCHNDRCLFMTNIEALPKPELISYNPYMTVTASERVHTDYNNASFYQLYSYSNAVDHDDTTAWKTTKFIRSGDYIGLDLLMPMRIPLKYRFLVRHPDAYQASLRFQTSFDGKSWIDISPTPSLTCNSMNDDDYDSIPLLDCRFMVSDTGYRFIRLESRRDLDFAMELYDFSISVKVKRDGNGHLLDNDGEIAFVDDLVN
ncbi:uncharacterized protein BYT42DRAFT_217027 [Radiomyces spectabilis]|uniref:uncharacterized protein n=1 Tax=Radiomyces spectabilis TaxID=64574 RepID=UPI0022205C34|nr:uncharacterized protein BYT42DRAFT_217027 [Radiomyces spectabilis]KAI8387995.1 hypothetical protein BYT42DRAFT_217027 [Radiomyces spectabilis]